ncbi:MAG: phosphoribosylanthranilate isomerase [Thermoleophilia bacterium]
MWPEPGGTPAVKICGLTRPDEAAACAALGVWGVGVVLAEGSPRRVAADTAARVLDPVPEGVARVGVFVDASADEMARVARIAGLTHLQVHGACDPARARDACGLPVIEGVRVDGAPALARARASAADLVLLDAAVAGLHGGTGTAFDWGLLDREPLGRPFGLAGGLRHDTVSEALARTRPSLVDVSSGVESAPGRKDPELVRAFVAAVAAAAIVA